MYLQVDLNTSRGVLSVQGEPKDVDALFPSVVEAMLLKLPHSIATVRYVTKAPILGLVLSSSACPQRSVLNKLRVPLFESYFFPPDIRCAPSSLLLYCS